MEEAVELHILRGPSKFELVLALFGGLSKSPVVYFTIDRTARPLEVYITGIQRDMNAPGPSERFFISGYVVIGNERRPLDGTACVYEIDEAKGTYSGSIFV